MDKKLRATTNLGVEIMNSKRHVKGKLGHVVQIDVNVMLNPPINKMNQTPVTVWATHFNRTFSIKKCHWRIRLDATKFAVLNSHWRLIYSVDSAIHLWNTGARTSALHTSPLYSASDCWPLNGHLQMIRGDWERVNNYLEIKQFCKFQDFIKNPVRSLNLPLNNFLRSSSLVL